MSERLRKLEIDAERARYGRMKRNSGDLNLGSKSANSFSRDLNSGKKTTTSAVT